MAGKKTLNQLCAAEVVAKAKIHQEVSAIHSLNQKHSLFEGSFERVEMINAGDADAPPPTQVNVQYNVADSIKSLRKLYGELFDMEATKDKSNMKAQADVVVDGQVVLTNVPATTLLYLAKKLDEIRDFVIKLPTLNPAHKWTYDPAVSIYKSEENRRPKTKKIPKPLVKYDATPEHPAQTEVFTEDTITGHFIKTEWSGAMKKQEQAKILENILKWQLAVAEAKAEANKVEVEEFKIADALLSGVFNVA